MPRATGSKNKKKPTFTGPEELGAEPIQLTANAQKLFDEISTRWRLDPCSEKLLMAAAIALSEAEKCNAVVEREGRNYLSRFNEPKIHPMVAESAKWVTLHTNALAKLMTGLE